MRLNDASMVRIFRVAVYRTTTKRRHWKTVASKLRRTWTNNGACRCSICSCLVLGQTCILLQMDSELLKTVAAFAALAVSIVSLVISLKTRRANVASNRATLTVKTIEIERVQDDCVELNVVAHNIGRSTAHNIIIQLTVIAVMSDGGTVLPDACEATVEHIGPSSEFVTHMYPPLPKHDTSNTNMNFFGVKISVLYDDEATGVGYHYTEKFVGMIVGKQPVTKELYRGFMPISATLKAKALLKDHRQRRV